MRIGFLGDTKQSIQKMDEYYALLGDLERPGGIPQTFTSDVALLYEGKFKIWMYPYRRGGIFLSPDKIRKACYTTLKNSSKASTYSADAQSGWIHPLWDLGDIRYVIRLLGLSIHWRRKSWHQRRTSRNMRLFPKETLYRSDTRQLICVYGLLISLRRLITLSKNWYPVLGTWQTVADSTGQKTNTGKSAPSELNQSFLTRANLADSHPAVCYWLVLMDSSRQHPPSPAQPALQQLRPKKSKR